METTIVYWGYIGIMEKKMETDIVCWYYLGEESSETTQGLFVCGDGNRSQPGLTPGNEFTRICRGNIC